MLETKIGYEDFLSGKMKRPLGNPIASYLEQRGARVRTNQFFDPTLKPSDSHLDNLLAIVRSGREQQLELLVITMNNGLHNEVCPTLERVQVLLRVITRSETSRAKPDSDGSLAKVFVYYPDIIWLESTYWNAKARAAQQAGHMNRDSLDRLKRLFKFEEFSEREQELVRKALDGR